MGPPPPDRRGPGRRLADLRRAGPGVSGSVDAAIPTTCGEHARRQGALNEAAELEQNSEFSRASIALERAKGYVAVGGADTLQARMNEIQRDLDLTRQLEAIREESAVINVGRQATAQFDSEYLATFDSQYLRTFESCNIVPLKEDPDAAAARIRAVPIDCALLAALDDWAIYAVDRSRRDRLL